MTNGADGKDSGNADRRSTWFAQALGEKPRKGKRRTNPRTVAIPAQTPTGAAWAPAGPAMVRNGQASGAPVVSGRVMDIDVGPQGRRAYAATADGGVWRYTEDHSVTPPKVEWVPLHDGVRSIDATTQGANALATGAVAVVWGTSPATDRLFIGTGEIHPRDPTSPTDTPSLDGAFPGIGIRVSSGEPGPSGVTQEALDLDGHGVTRLVIDPDDDEVVWAATDNGLFTRPTSGTRENWTAVTDTSFPSNSWYVTDLAITGSGATKVVWVAFWHRGIWRLSGGTWSQIPGIAPTANAPGNMVLATGHEPATAGTVYVLDQTSGVHRFDGTRFRQLNSTPPLLVDSLGNYALGLAVRPGNDDHIVIGSAAGLGQPNPLYDQDHDAKFFGAVVAAAGPTWNFGFTPANNADRDHSRDPLFIGAGVHPDIHRITYGRLANGSPDPNDLWVGCDGGVFRSTAGPTNGAFRSLNVGLSSIQFNHMASHPSVESVVLAGSQDNGVIRRSGDSSWFEKPKSDGGGVAIDPNNPRRMIAQLFRASIRSSRVGGIGSGDWGTVTLPLSTNETAPFYMPFRTSPAGAAPTLVLFPTHRIWASADWGRNWYTLPTGRRPTAAQINLNTLGTGTGDTVLDVHVSNATTLHAITSSRVYRMTRTTAPTAARPVGVWNAHPPLPTTGLPGTANILSFVVESASAPERIYVGLGGTSRDHVYWFDSVANRWQPTGLDTANSSFDAPVNTLAFDPAIPNEVFAGSPVGVWRGVRTITGGTASWTWTNMSNQLPEATVLDLDVGTFGTGAGALRLLRAATHGRGMWELNLGLATTPDPDVHLRMNGADAGRRHSTARGVADPERMPGATTSWLDSPDIRLRRSGLPLSPVPELATPTPGATAPPTFDTTLRRGHKDRRRWNGTNGRRPIRFVQRHIARRGVQVGIDGDFGGGTQTAVQVIQRRYAISWRPSGRVDAATWRAITSDPDLGTAPIDPRQFAEDVRPDMDEATGAMLADATGTNRLFVQLHARGTQVQAASDVRVALLLAALTGTPRAAPTLPNGWAARIRAGDTSGWVGASGWVLAGGASPYRSPPGDLTDRGPEIVEWVIDFSALGFNAGDEIVALAAIHTPDQNLTTGERNAKTAVETLPAVAARHIRLDAVTAIPPP